jgi:hypothetical protein
MSIVMINLRRSFFLMVLVSIGLPRSGRGADGARQSLVGTLVDVTCATDPKQNIARLRSDHTRRCLLMPVCSESGYALLMDNNDVIRFDTGGNSLALKLIEGHSRNQNWRVSVEGSVEEKTLIVRHLKLIKTK